MYRNNSGQVRVRHWSQSTAEPEPRQGKLLVPGRTVKMGRLAINPAAPPSPTSTLLLQASLRTCKHVPQQAVPAWPDLSPWASQACPAPVCTPSQMYNRGTPPGGNMPRGGWWGPAGAQSGWPVGLPQALGGTTTSSPMSRMHRTWAQLCRTGPAPGGPQTGWGELGSPAPDHIPLSMAQGTRLHSLTAASKPHLREPRILVVDVVAEADLLHWTRHKKKSSEPQSHRHSADQAVPPGGLASQDPFSGPSLTELLDTCISMWLTDPSLGNGVKSRKRGHVLVFQPGLLLGQPPGDHLTFQGDR